MDTKCGKGLQSDCGPRGCITTICFLSTNEPDKSTREKGGVGAAFVTNSSVINIPLYTQCEREMKIPHCNPSVPLLYNGKGT